MIILEYCQFGNLQSYLIKNRNSFINQVDESGNLITADETDNSPVNQQVTETPVSSPRDSGGYLVPNSPTDERNETEACQPMSTKDLVSWSFQIARGMSYLSRKKVIITMPYRVCEMNREVNFPNFSGSARRLGRPKYFVGGQRSRQSVRFRHGSQNVLRRKL